jgi:hypothetical protein
MLIHVALDGTLQSQQRRRSTETFANEFDRTGAILGELMNRKRLIMVQVAESLVVKAVVELIEVSAILLQTDPSIPLQCREKNTPDLFEV